MNTNFVFPPQQGRTPRPQQRPQKQTDAPSHSSRDSNTLRASVLDVALQLGIGSNSLVADWMFNNAVHEEEETEDLLSPKKSAPSPLPDSQSPQTPINGNTNTINGTRLPPGTAVDLDAGNPGKGKPVAFPDAPDIPPVSVTPAPSVHSTATASKNKLKKSRKGAGDGYESESAEGGRKVKEKKKMAMPKEKEADPDQRKRKRSFVDTVIGKKGKDIDSGYATDGSGIKSQKSKNGKSKSKSMKDEDLTEYETDGGTKKSKKKSFFKLSSKSSKPDLKDREPTPPLPQMKEQMPLPIALRFAKALDSPTTHSMDETRSTTSNVPPMSPPPIDESRSTASQSVVLPSAVSSKSTVNEGPPLSSENLPSKPLTVAQPPASSLAPSQLPSSLASFPTLPPLATIRDSQASSESSSSVASNSQSRTSTGAFSTANSNVSTTFTSPSTSHFQIASPRTGAGSISTSASVSQLSPGLGYGQTHRMDAFTRPSGAASRPTSPPSSAATAAAVAGKMQFQIVRDMSTVPLIMRQQQQQEPQQLDPEPPAQIQDDGQAPTQIPQVVEAEQVETYPRRMSVAYPPIAPLHISKGSLLRPSLEKLNLFGKRKDNLPGGSTPSPVPSPSATPTAPLNASQSTPSLVPAGQHGIPILPMQQPVQSGRSRSGRPLSPPQKSNQSVPPPNPPPMGPLPIPPLGPLPMPPQLPGDVPRTGSSPIPRPQNRSHSPIAPPTNPALDPSTQFPSPAQLRQRMLDRTPRKMMLRDEATHPPSTNSTIRQSMSRHSIIRRGKEAPFPAAPLFQKTRARSSSVGASDESGESGEGVHIERPPRSPMILPGPLNHQEKKVLDSVLSRKGDNRSSWVNFGDDLLSRDRDGSEEDADGFLPDNSSEYHSRSEESVYSTGVRSLARSRSSEALRPVNHHPAQNGYAWDDSMTVGDRTSRWSGSIYSRISIMDEEESNNVRDRFVQRVEAMLADSSDPGETGRNVAVARSGGGGGGGGRGRAEYIPPVPKIPDAFASSIRPKEAQAGPAVRSMWNKF